MRRRPAALASVALLAGHLTALVFGTIGILIALPNPWLWKDSELGREAFRLGMAYSGSLHMVLGAAAMFAFGVWTLGWRKTVIFFAVTYPFSLGSELLGTGTGWPFGAYSYVGGLGEMVLDRVPYTIPLSWFYMGFAAYLLASAIAGELRLVPRAAWSVGLGVWFLTVWDLVLDPAMAHEALPIRFWTWHETGPYFGMPIKNLVGWSLTGLLFMAISRLLWREDVTSAQMPAWYPLTVYVANTLFAMALSLSVGLWQPVALAAILGLVPAALTWRPDLLRRRPGHPSRLRRSPTGPNT